MARAFETILHNDDILESIAVFLDCKDLLGLSLTCKQCLLTVEEVALRMLQSSGARFGGIDADEELSTLEELNRLRSPVEFTDLLGERIGYVDGDKSCIYSSNPNRLHTAMYIANMTMEGGFDDWSGTENSAICSNYVMTSGKHYAKFTISTCDPIVIFRYVYCRIGIMRPIDCSEWNVREFCPIHSAWFNDFLEEKTEAWGESNVHCCLYYDFEGTCDWSDWAPYPGGKRVEGWTGMQGLDIYDGEVGLLLDLDEGTLTVYLNGRRLGVMMRGLSGEYCWIAQITAQANGRPREQNVRIERAPVPVESQSESSSRDERRSGNESSSSSASGSETSKTAEEESSEESGEDGEESSPNTNNLNDEDSDDISSSEDDSSDTSEEQNGDGDDDDARRQRTKDFIFELMRAGRDLQE